MKKIVLLFGIIVYFLLQPDGKMVHCAEVKDEKMFTGRKLLSEEYIFRSVVPVESCLKRDEITDQNDGPEKGKVRWVKCLSGPDCDEAGLF